MKTNSKIIAMAQEIKPTINKATKVAQKNRAYFPKTKQEAIDLYLTGQLKKPDGRFYFRQFGKQHPGWSKLLSLLSPIWILGLGANLMGNLLKPYLPGHKPTPLSQTTRALSYYLMKFCNEEGSLNESKIPKDQQINQKKVTYLQLQKEVLERAKAIQKDQCNRIGHYISNHRNRKKILLGFNIKTDPDNNGKPHYSLQEEIEIPDQTGLKQDTQTKEAIHYSLGKVKYGALQMAYYLGKILAFTTAVATFISIFSTLAPTLGLLAAPIGAAITVATVIGLFASANSFGKYNTILSNSFCALLFFRDFRFKDKKSGEYKKMDKTQITATSIFVPIALASATITAVMTYSTLHGILMTSLVAAGVASPPVAGILAASVGICLAGLIIHSGLKVIQQKSFGIKNSMNKFVQSLVGKDNQMLGDTQLKAIFIASFLPAITLLVLGAVLDSFNLFQQLPSTILGFLPDQVISYFGTSAHNIAAIPLLIEGSTHLATKLASVTTKILNQTPARYIRQPILLGAIALAVQPATIAIITVDITVKLVKSIILLPVILASKLISKVGRKITNPFHNAGDYSLHRLTKLSESTQSILSFDKIHTMPSSVEVATDILNLDAKDSNNDVVDVKTYGDTMLLSR